VSFLEWVSEKIGLLTYKHEKQEIEFSTLASVRARKEEPEAAAAQEQLMPRHLCVMRIAPSTIAPAAVQLFLVGCGNYCQRRTRVLESQSPEVLTLAAPRFAYQAGEHGARLAPAETKYLTTKQTLAHTRR